MRCSTPLTGDVFSLLIEMMEISFCSLTHYTKKCNVSRVSNAALSKRLQGVFAASRSFRWQSNKDSFGCDSDQKYKKLLKTHKYKRMDGCSSVSLVRFTRAEACLKWFLKGRLDFRLKLPRLLKSIRTHGWQCPLSSAWAWLILLKVHVEQQGSGVRRTYYRLKRNSLCQR